MGNVVEAGGDLLGAAGEFAAGQRFQHQRRDEAVTEQRDFFGFVVHGVVFLLARSVRRKAARFHANGVWGSSGGRGGGGERGATAVGSQTARPAQQVVAQAGEQEAVSGDPAGGFEHAAERGGRSRARVWAGSARPARRTALRLARESGESRTGRAGKASAAAVAAAFSVCAVEQSGDEKQRDHRQR